MTRRPLPYEESEHDERERSLHAEMRAHLDAAEHELPDPRLYAKTLEDVRTQAHLRLVSEHALVERRAKLPSNALRGPMGATIFAAAVAAVALLSRAYFHAPIKSSRAVAAVGISKPVRAELVMAAGEVEIDQRAPEVGGGPLAAGQRISAQLGRACVVIDPQIDVCIDAETEIALDSLAEDAVVVRLMHGTAVAALAPRARGHSFVFASGDVAATAHGTVFAVKRGDGSSTDVVVMEGSVAVTHAGRSAAVLSAHSRISLGGDSRVSGTELVGRSEEALLMALVAPRALWQDKTLGLLKVAANRATAEVSVGELGPLPLPLTVFAPLGSERLVLRDAVGLELTAEVTVSAGQTRYVDFPEPVATVPGTPLATVRESAAGLLVTARRALGRDGAKGALPVYRRLLSTYPNSPEAFTVLITVGQLELEEHAPGRALSAFDAYLKRGGSLAPEALAGKIRALRALGRIREERTAITIYLDKFPQGFEATVLRRRLEALD